VALLTEVSGQSISPIFKVRRFETNQRSHLLGPLKIGLKGCPETSGRNYHYSLCNSPKERSSRESMCFELWFSRDDAIQITPTEIWGRVIWKILNEISGEATAFIIKVTGSVGTDWPRSFQMDLLPKDNKPCTVCNTFSPTLFRDCENDIKIGARY